ncbi:glycoside hydrolase family 6 protein [Cellulomonas sp. NPDC057328]|uniref:glycoside hydrolase family 6 protein n=1 Tax=Cellulomonas sp. NPDC057328 TaxID=3346101 RepID=UPI003634D1ED
MPPTSRGPRVRLLAVAVAAVVVAVLALTLPSPARTPAPADALEGGQELGPGDALHAAGDAELAVQPDGDVVLRTGGRVRWHTGTAGHPGARLVQRGSGALQVLAADDDVLWDTGVEAPGARTVLAADGTVRTVDEAGADVWASTTDGPALRTQPADRVPGGGVLLPGEHVVSGDGRVRLGVGEDGTFTLRAGDDLLWAAPAAPAGVHATVTADGDVRLVGPDGTVAWSTGTAAPGARLVVKDHGRAYLVGPDGRAVWSTPALPGERAPTVVGLPLPDPLPRPDDADAARPQNAGSDAPAWTTVLADAPPYVDPSSAAARAARTAREEGRDEDADLLDKAAAHVSARWLGPTDTAADVRAWVDAARAAGRTPVLVTYAIPDRDCGSHSAGGLTTHEEYAAWADDVAAGLAGARAVVVVEPDALLHLERCGDRDARLEVLRHSVDAYVAAGAEVYLDAASSNSFGWSADALRDMALRLRAAGVDRAAGFAVNTANFQRSEHEVAYGRYLSALLGGAAFVVDTSRNGNGPLAGEEGTEWCNPPGRALGARPGATGTGPHVADLWVKTVGLSDGTCRGGPPAGRFWEEYTLGLAARADW